MSTISIAGHVQNIVNNPTVIAVLATLTALFTSTIGPGLSSPVKNLFENDVFRFIVIFAVAYLSSARRPVIAIVAAFSFLYISSILAEQKSIEHFTARNLGIA